MMVAVLLSPVVWKRKINGTGNCMLPRDLAQIDKRKEIKVLGMFFWVFFSTYSTIFCTHYLECVPL